MQTKYVLVIIIIILAILFLYNKQENLDATGIPLSNEAIQNIASVYNNQNMQVTNLKVTNDINAIGNINASGTINAGSSLTSNNIFGSLTSPNKKYQINMQDNGDMAIYDVESKKNIWAVGKNGISTDTNFNDKAKFGGTGMRIWKQPVWNGTLLTDGVIPYFTTDKWVVITAGGRFTGGNATAPFTYTAADGKWYGAAYAGYNMTCLAIPLNLFESVHSNMNQI